MISYLSLGSNSGDRHANVIAAITKLEQLDVVEAIRISPIYETPALIPKSAPSAWLSPFLNLVVEINIVENFSAIQFLKELKQIELHLGRPVEHETWSPRIIDIDILLYGELEIQSEELTLPHPGLTQRSFVLDPLKDLNPTLRLGQPARPILQLAREAKQHSPLWMGIINVTPDSFSDGGAFTSPNSLKKHLLELKQCGTQIFDFGAESTRPNAQLLSSNDEFERLKNPLEEFHQLFSDSYDRPLLSLDTRHIETVISAQKVTKIDIVNDVSGMTNPEWIPFLKDNSCDYILMHSETIPADPSKALADDIDPISYLKNWLEIHLEQLDKNGIDRRRIIFDPGIGFGKSALQSLNILKNINAFDYPDLRLLVGHSRKSFMNAFTSESFQERDFETIGISLGLIQSGVDILRVHNVAAHQRSFLAWNHLN